MPSVGVRVSSNVEKQKSLHKRAATPSHGRNPVLAVAGAQTSAASVTWTNAEPDTLMERVLARNKGAPVDLHIKDLFQPRYIPGIYRPVSSLNASRHP
jgi:hypothetical protein